MGFLGPLPAGVRAASEGEGYYGSHRHLADEAKQPPNSNPKLSLSPVTPAP